MILVGDGAFQMTGMELSTAVRYGCNPIVVVLDNDGYTTERFHTDGEFNTSCDGTTAGSMNCSAAAGLRGRDGTRPRPGAGGGGGVPESFYLIDVRLERFDASDALRATFWSNREREE